MRSLWPVIAAAAVVVCITSASAQVQSVSRTASGAPDTDIRVGVFVNVRPDCTSGPLLSIQLTSPPENGKVTVKKATVTATNHAVLGAAGAGVRRLVSLAGEFCGRRCSDLGSEISRVQDGGAADQDYGRKWIARA